MTDELWDARVQTVIEETGLPKELASEYLAVQDARTQRIVDLRRLRDEALDEAAKYMRLASNDAEPGYAHIAGGWTALAREIREGLA